jgi:predicted RNA methylase
MTSRIEHNNPKNQGGLDLTYHYEMLSDPKRIPPFKEAIEKICKDQIVLESGTGSAILSLLAARAGAKQVFATELDPKVAEFARKNITRSGFKNIRLIEKSTTALKPEDLDGLQPTVVIAENLSTWQVTEPEIQVMNYITENLAADGAIRLPAIMENQLELCHAEFSFYGLVSLRSHFFEFTGIPPAETLSKPVVYSRLDFTDHNAEQFEGRCALTVKQDGIVNSVRLTSPLVVHDGIYFSSSDSLMPPVIFPLGSDRTVQEGETLTLQIQYESCTGWDRFKVQIVDE